jgi:hypothetical protein
LFIDNLLLLFNYNYTTVMLRSRGGKGTKRDLH